jgi:hypothetical protein
MANSSRRESTKFFSSTPGGAAAGAVCTIGVLMMTLRKPATDSLVSKLKRTAKLYTNETTTYTQALDALAVEAGYTDWRTLAMANGLRNAELTREFPLDPVLPPDFDNTPNEDRSDSQIATWWNKPFILSSERGGFDVRCLCSGSWDRSTWWGHADSLAAADELARTKLAWWLRVESRPLALMRGDGLVDVDRLPGWGHRTIHSGLTPEAARAIVDAYVE